MFFIKNAIKNIYRYKTRYILFGILYFIIIFISEITINLYFYMIKINDNLLKEYCNVVKIESSEHISKMSYMEYLNSQYIEDVKIRQYNFCTSGLNGQFFDKENIQLYTSNGLKTLDYLLYNPVFIFGYKSDLLYLSDLELNINKGRMFWNNGECIISQNRKRYDNWNTLDIGDIIVFENSEGIYKEFTVVGILKEDVYNDHNTNKRFIHTSYENSEYFEDVLGVNQYNGYDIDAEHGLKKSIRLGYDALIYLKNYNDFDNFFNEVLTKSNYTRFVVPLFSDFYTVRNFINTIKGWSILFTILIIFILISMTIIITIMFLNMRKYEIAVLCSIGMKKSRIIISYLMENITFVWGITVISFINAQFISKIVSGFLLTDIQNLIPAENVSDIFNTNIWILLQNTGVVFGGMTAIIMLSLILACINIIRFEPLKIFNKQY